MNSLFGRALVGKRARQGVADVRGMMFAVACMAILACSAASAAEDWPRRQPISLILPAGAGGSSDPLARLMAEEIGKRIGQSIVVLNRPGAGGNMGMAQAARAPADGYTVAISWTGPLATNLALYKEVGYDPRRDFAPIGTIGCTPNVLAVDRGHPSRTLKEFEEFVRARPGKVTYGTTGVGSSWHIAGEMLGRDAGAPLIHVPYTTPGAALTDLRGGQIQAITPVVPMTVPHVRSGDIRVLAVFSTQRSSVLPDVPTTLELGSPDLVSETCFALLLPRSTPAPIVNKLNAAMNQVLTDAKSRELLEGMGLQIKGGQPSELTRYLDSEIPRQAALVKASGAVPQ